MQEIVKSQKPKIALTIRKIPYHDSEYLVIGKCLKCGKRVLKSRFNHFGFYNIEATPCEHTKNTLFFKGLANR